MQLEDRYNREYQIGKTTFYLTNFYPTQKQCEYLMLKVLEHAVREYITLYQSESSHDQMVWALARDFLFDDTYRFTWGKWELSFKDFLDILDLDADWTRRKINKQLKREINDKAQEKYRKRCISNWK